MVIIEFAAENVKRIQHVKITPKSSLVMVTGRNGQGKSSVLDSIMYALCGARYIPPRPVRDGEEFGEITVDLGDYKVTRVLRSDGNTSVKVMAKDGAEYRKPQELLNRLTGEFLDPLEFSRKPDKERVALVRRLVPVDWDDVDKKREKYANEYTRRNQTLRQANATLQSHAAAWGEKLADAPAEAINIASLIEQREAIQRENFTRQKLKQKLYENASRIGKLRCDIETLQRALASAEQAEIEITAEIQAAGEDESVGDLGAQIEDANAKNALLREVGVYGALKADAAKAVDALGQLTEDRARWEDALQKQVAEHALPVPNLVLSPDGGLMLNGVPLEQASASEQIRVGLRLAIQFSPEIRVILVREGSLLDSDSLAEIERFADERGCQIWVEKVSDQGADPVGIVIEDGLVAATGP